MSRVILVSNSNKSKKARGGWVVGAKDTFLTILVTAVAVTGKSSN